MFRNETLVCVGYSAPVTRLNKRPNFAERFSKRSPDGAKRNPGCSRRKDPAFRWRSMRATLADPALLHSRELRERHVELLVIPVTGLELGEDTAVEILFEDRHVVMVPHDSKWARRHNVKLADLMGEPWVLPPRGTPIDAYLTQGFRAAGLEPPRMRVATFSLPLHEQLLASGTFVTALPGSMVRFGRQLPFKVLPIAFPSPARPIGIVTLKNRMVSPLAEVFLDCARELARSPAAVPHGLGRAEKRPKR
jgi:DNA-binding transcriptional LysR family regulator